MTAEVTSVVAARSRSAAASATARSARSRRTTDRHSPSEPNVTVPSAAGGAQGAGVTTAYRREPAGTSGRAAATHDPRGMGRIPPRTCARRDDDDDPDRCARDGGSASGDTADTSGGRDERGTGRLVAAGPRQKARARSEGDAGRR
jgi:hypothetical protein